jgi:hypothetical protein
MARHIILAGLLAAAGLTPASAQDPEPSPPARETLIEVYGDDPCPQSSGEETVVCARRPEEERYRIPAPLRRSTRPPEQAWGARVESLDEVSRSSRPGSCSVVGTYGQSGCTQQMIREWYNERRARRGR